jgi:flavin-dependent dehydrogenase
MVLVGDAVHARSNSSGQGASPAIESALELARYLRDLPEAFAAYEGLRRRRAMRVARRGARVKPGQDTGTGRQAPATGAAAGGGGQESPCGSSANLAPEQCFTNRLGPHPWCSQAVTPSPR